MEDATEEDPGEEVVCDWCGSTEAVGTFFVPGKGVLNLCENCRMILLAVLIDAT